MRGENSVLFIGHFSRSGAHRNPFASAAGDVVQNQIIKEASHLLPKEQLRFLSMEPQRIWPAGSLYIRGSGSDNGRFVSYINLPIIKNICYAAAILLECFRLRPALVMQYNSYLFENAAILVAAMFLRIRSCLILQDIRIGHQFSLAARIYDKFANMLVGFFDFVMPISRRMAEELQLKDGQFHIFKGGITGQGYELLQCNEPLGDYAVFAGALESHNGIDRIVQLWVDRKVEVDLHVFGRGRLADMVSHYSRLNPHIKYHGFIPHEDVSKWQRSAKFNFCLRYSEGLEEEYFFPSKFFNACCCPGLLIVNNFMNIPSFMLGKRGLVNDLDGVEQLLRLSNDEVMAESLLRRQAVLEEGSWSSALGVVVKRFFDLSSNSLDTK